MDEEEVPLENNPEPLSPLESKEEPPGPVSNKIEKTSRKFSLRKFNQQLATTVSILLKLGGLVIFIMVVLAIRRELVFKGYSLQEIRVPESFDKNGYGGDIVAMKIQAYIDGVKTEFKKDEGFFGTKDNLELSDYSDYAIDNKESDVEVNMMIGVGLPVKSIIGFIANSLGISQSKKVIAFLATDDLEAILTIYIEGEPPQRIAASMEKIGLEKTIDQLTTDAAKHILKVSNPEMLAWFLRRTSRDWNKIIELCRYSIEGNPNSIRNKYSYYLLGLALSTQGKFEEAAESYRKSITVDPNYLEPYLGLIISLSTLNRYDDLKEVDQNMMRIGKHVASAEKMGNLEFTYAMYLSDYYVGSEHVNLDSAYYWNEKSLHTLPSFTKDGTSIGQFSTYTRWLAIAMYRAGKEKESDRIMRNLSRLIESNSVEPAVLAYNYGNFALYFTRHEAYDSAALYAQKSIEADSNHFIGYRAMAEMYGFQKNSDKFYYYFDKAMSKRFVYSSVQFNVLPYTNFNEEKGFKELVDKYRTK